MQFCDDCGSMMRKEGEEMVCASCGATAEQDAEAAEQFVSTETQTGEELIESDPDANFEAKPTASGVSCDDCGNDEAWYTIKQTASADEPPTRFFKCTDCHKIWRGYN